MAPVFEAVKGWNTDSERDRNRERERDRQRERELTCSQRLPALGFSQLMLSDQNRGP